MGSSSDPVKRAAQLANLRQNAAVKHGATSEAKVRPLREQYLAELRQEFPNASERRLLIQAHRLGQLELLGIFADERGVIRHRRRGDVFPAAALAERIATSYLAEHDRLEQQEREAGASNGHSLGAIEAELAGDGDDDGS
jgi:hypothetical protein